jgi:hypothetical protein
MKPRSPMEPHPVARASAVESLIELYSERWNKIGSQDEALRLQAEIAHAAKTLAPEELLAYAAAPSLRGQLLALCVAARAQQRAAARGSAAAPTAAHIAETDALLGDAPSPWDLDPTMKAR